MAIGNSLNFINGGNYEQRIFSVLQKSIKQIRRFTGGVLSIQGNVASVDTINNNTSYTRNSNLIANGSAIKSVQRGYYQQEVRNNLRPTIVIPVSITNPSKCWFEHNTIAKGFNGTRVYEESVTLDSRGIVISLELSTSNGLVEVTCDWQVIEFY